MKELFQAVDIEKCIPLFKRVMASLIICSMLMIDVAKAMDPNEDDPRLLKIVQRTPSPTPAADLRNSENGFSGHGTSSTDEDLSPRSISPTSMFPVTGLDIIDSKPSSDDSSSSPEKSPPDASQSLPIIPFSAFSPSSSQNIPSALPPSSSPRQPQPEDFGTPPGAESFPDRVPLLQSTEKDPLLGSGKKSSYGSSNSSGSSNASDSSSDSENDAELGRAGHSQSESPKTPSTGGFRGALELVIKRFISTQSSTTDQSASGTSTTSEDDENGEDDFLFGQGNASIQSQDPEYGGLPVDLDFVGDENSAPQSRFLPTWFSEWFSDRPFWPEKPEYRLGNGEEDEALRIVALAASQFLAPVRSRHAPESHDSESDGERSSSFSASSGSDSPTQGSPTSPRNVALPPDSSDSEGDGTAHLLSSGHPHGAVRSYSSLRAMLPYAQGPGSTAGVVLPHPGSLSPQDAWLELLDGLKDLPAKTKTQLTNFASRNLYGETTWPERLGKWIIGPLIGLGFAYYMGPVYTGSFIFLKSESEWLNGIADSNVFNYISWYITFSALFDGIPRGAHLLKKGIAYLSQEGKETKRIFLVGFISFLTAFIPPSYLITGDLYAIQQLGLQGWNPFYREMAIGGLALFGDAYIANFDAAWKALPQMKEWLGNLWCRQSLRAQLPVLQEDLHKKFNKSLKYLEHFLFRAPKFIIDEIYDNVMQAKEDAPVSCCENYDEALTLHQVFAVLIHLLSFSDEIVQGVSKQKSTYDISADIFKKLCLLSGTPARALTLQFIGYSVFSLFCPDPIAQILGGIYMIFALLPQTYLEDQGMDNFFKRFIFEEDPHGHGAHPLYRGLTKLYCVLQGLIYTFPLAVLTLQAFQQWFGNGWWPLAAATPFLFPEAAAQIYGFNGTFNQLVVTSITNVHNTKTRKFLGKEPTSDWKRDWLIRFAQDSRAELKHWHPDLMQKLREGIETLQKSES